MKFSTTYDVSILDPVESPAGGTIQATNMVYNRLLGFKNGAEMNPFSFSSSRSSRNRGSAHQTGLSTRFTLPLA